VFSGVVGCDTFSIRYRLPSGQPTDFANRLTSTQGKDKDKEHLFPHFTMQANLYQTGGSLLSCGVI